MIREKMLDQVKEEHPRIASYVRLFGRSIDSKDKAKSIRYFFGRSSETV